MKFGKIFLVLHKSFLHIISSILQTFFAVNILLFSHQTSKFQFTPSLYRYYIYRSVRVGEINNKYKSPKLGVPPRDSLSGRLAAFHCHRAWPRVVDRGTTMICSFTRVYFGQLQIFWIRSHGQTESIHHNKSDRL